MMSISAIRRSLMMGIALSMVSLFAMAWAQNLVVLGDMVIGHENYEGTTCVLTNRFLHEQQVVFRAKVVDPMTSAELSDAELTSVAVTLVDGQVFEMEYGEHPPREPVDGYWTAAWVIPADYPSGVVDFTITATAADGRTGDLITFPIEASLLTILPE
jgi:hypothetical protein